MTKTEALELCERMGKDLDTLLDHLRNHPNPRALLRSQNSFRNRFRRQTEASLYVAKSIINNP
jgi:hypothetical protein